MTRDAPGFFLRRSVCAVFGVGVPGVGMAGEPAAAVPAAGVWEMLGSLLFVLAIVFALAWLVRALQGARFARGATLQIQGGLRLGAKESVVLLQVGEQQFLLGVAPGSVRLLHRFEQPVIPAQPGASPPLSAFAERLRQAMGGKSLP